MINYDIAIIGAGPAGLFAAYHILEHCRTANVILIEKGKAVPDRKCCESCQTCAERERCSILCGVGGGGLFSDGKLILDLHSGGKLDAITNLSEEKRESLKSEIVDTLKRHDGVSELSASISVERQEAWCKRCGAEGLQIKHYDVLHMGSENLYHITTSFANEVCGNPHVSLKLNSEVVRLEDGSGGQTILYTKDGDAFSAANVIFSVGKTGSDWLNKLFKENGIQLRKGTTYLGVRIEAAHEAMQELFEYSFDPKIWTYYGRRKVKTHCFCRHGDIVCSNYMGFPMVGGHTRYTKENCIPSGDQSSRGNFNILVSTECSDRDILCILERFRQINSDGVVVQRLLEFLSLEKAGAGRKVAAILRSKPGNIRRILDDFESTGKIISDFVLRLSKIVPGILSEDSLVYAPALEWFMNCVEVDSNMETSRKGWFAVGDGAGLSQGIVHSAATSIIAAEEICRRIKK